MNWGERNLLHLLWGIPLLWAFLIWAGRNRRKALERLFSPQMAKKLVTATSTIRRRLQAGFLLSSIACFCLAAARPQWGTKLETVIRRGVDVVVAIDTSLSMETKDVVPNRLERAKHMLQSLIEQLQGDRVGVVAFAGSAFVECPLTLDHGAARMFLDILNTRTIPTPGTNLGVAIRTATKAFNQKEKKYKVLVLLTDGEDHEGDWKEASKEARVAGVLIYCIGIGTSSGQPIPIRDEQGTVSGYKKDENGEVVVSRLDETTLQGIAGTTGGKYYFATATEQEIDDLRQEIDRMDKRELESKVVRNYEERFQYFVAAGLIFLIAEMLLRRSW